MARIFITGSADGLGQMAATLLVQQGHTVILHARNPARAQQALQATPGVNTALSADLSSIQQTIRLAEEVNRLGPIDAVIHNAAVGYREPTRIATVDGLPQVFAVNSLAPYILTCLIKRPTRLIYISSGLHRQTDGGLDDLEWKKTKWNGFKAYSDSKLHDVIIAFAVARKWKDVYANALEPGWVATKMGGSSAPDNLEDGPKTQAWLAVSNDPAALVTGEYFYHMRPTPFNPLAKDGKVQENFLQQCEKLSGIAFPS
ncbi:MAG TPA: SDR family NAD(P)-dependent oxidoreductase [Puia sp.]|nr:SDR family NAD(P)-dependent oxidoreductase [Puia sp.]